MIQERLIKSLLMIEKVGSFTKAAELLYTTQSSLSRMVIGLEKELGVQLFDRQSFPVRPTYFGKMYLKSCREVLVINSATESMIRETLEGTQGHITFGLSRFLSRCFSHLIISEFSAVSPKVKLVLLEGSSPSLEDKLLDGDVDLALVAGRRNEPRLEYIHVINEKIVLAVPPSFAREFGLLPGENELPIPPEQLSRYPFILLRPSHGLRNYANFFFDQVGIRPPTSYETEEIDVAISLTNDDFGLSFTSAISAEMSTIVHPQYYCTLSNMPQQTRQISICRNKGVYHLKAEEDLIRITSDIVKKAILPL